MTIRGSGRKLMWIYTDRLMRTLISGIRHFIFNLRGKINANS